jgi:leucyl aminopeptidase (aminopeptidase T)
MNLFDVSREIADRLTRADGAICTFSAGGSTHILRIDLRFRDAHVSGGIINRPGTVANLPSGEAYIVPYEGERAGIDSNTEGILPVQFGEEIVLFQIVGNRAAAILSEGAVSEAQAARLKEEPAYGNLAELGIGVLSEWGVSAVGSTLLDEKLGPHIAFGRSDHFGGSTGPAAFKDPAQVIHIDWVYVESLQPKVVLQQMKLVSPSGVEDILIDDGKLAG